MAIFGSFGERNFTLFQNPASSDSSVSYGWDEHKRIEGKPVLQDTSDDLEKIRFTFQYAIGMSDIDPDTEIQAWKDLAASKTPQDLVIGEVFKGQFVITDLRITISASSDDGRTIAAKIDINLLESVGVEPAEPPVVFAGFQRNA